MNKPRVVKDYEKLDIEIKEQLKLQFPYGFDKYLITFKDAKDKFVSALPFESTDRSYLIRMSQELASKIILDDQDYDEFGHLKHSAKEAYYDKYEDESAESFDIVEEAMMEEHALEVEV